MDNVKNFLKAIGFTLKDGESELIYSKTYENFNNYEISLKLNEDDVTKSIINYGKDIKYGRTTTQNLHQKETFVVLECIDRLITKGYSPKEIIIEKDYPSGGKDKGQYLDILITKEGLPFYMVECKRYGDAYDDEFQKLNNNGGQLFTYFTNDRAVKAICLYSSRLFDGKIEPHYCIIDTSDFEGSDRSDIFNKWNKEFSNSGIFDCLYGADSIGITREQLKSLSEDKKLYNGFARILRKYAVSDLTNAYNKLFNLFLCKIVDEDKLYSDNDYNIQFQWKKEDTGYDVLGRLSNLYKEGIEKYLRIDVTDYSKDKFIANIEKLSQGNKDLCQELIKEFNELRFIKNNEFSFIEVFNMETFKQNSLILKAVVKLLETFRIKYTDKQQFLGDFFERLLNIGIKQTEGQFFTPIPIANFIVNSIPFESIINNKINNNDDKFLPYMIDYACGAGHFITEYMHRIEPILNKYTTNDMKTNLQVKNCKKWINNQYEWAEEFVYGIEKDYRLTKTSKIACFLNGDGDANIITGNGLDSFDSQIFKNTILYQDIDNTAYTKDQPVFDCVIANPPYSVQDFKETLKKTSGEPYGKKNFDLFESLGKDADDIECLFLERTKQLLKEGGFAAVIVANTILSNPGIHENTRKLLIENFKIKAIVELGKGAFMATDSNTIILFMEKRTSAEVNKVKDFINKFKQMHTDMNFNNKSKVISQFVYDNYEDINFDDYVSLFNKQPNSKFKNTDLYKEYKEIQMEKLKNLLKKKKNDKNIQEKINSQNIDLEELIELELEKMYIYFLNQDINTLLVTTGKSKDAISSFLGYKFSKRKGDEGLKELSDKDIKELDAYSNREAIQSKLYNPHEILDNSKINYYIYKHLSNNLNEDDISKLKINFSKNASYTTFNNLIEYDDIVFNYNIGLESKKKIKFETKLETEKLKNLVEIDYGTRIVKSKEEGTLYPVYGGGGETFRADKYNREDSFIISRFGMSKHCVRYVKDKFFLNDSGFTLRLTGNKCSKEYLENILICFEPIVYACGRGTAQKNIDIRKFNKIRIPIPDKTTQKIVTSELINIENKKTKLEKDIEKIEQQINNLFLDTVNNSSLQKLNKYISLEYGKALPEYERIDGEFPVIGSNGIIGYHNDYMIEAPCIIVGRKGSVGKVKYIEQNCTPIDTSFYVLIKDGKIRLKYAYYLLKSLKLETMNTGLGPGGINRNKIYNLQVKVPECSRQDIFLEKISKYEQEIEDIKTQIKQLPSEKQAIVDKYLR